MEANWMRGGVWSSREKHVLFTFCLIIMPFYFCCLLIIQHSSVQNLSTTLSFDTSIQFQIPTQTNGKFFSFLTRNKSN